MSKISNVDRLHKCSPDASWGLLDPDMPAAERIRRLRQLRGSLRTLYGVEAHAAADAISAAILDPDNPALIEAALAAIKVAGRQPVPCNSGLDACEARP